MSNFIWLLFGIVSKTADGEIARLGSQDDQPAADRVGGAEIFESGALAEGDIGRAVQRLAGRAGAERQAEEAEEIGMGDDHVLAEGLAVAAYGQERRIGPADLLDLREVLEQRRAQRTGGEGDLVRRLSRHRLDRVDPIEALLPRKPVVVVTRPDWGRSDTEPARSPAQKVDGPRGSLPLQRPQRHLQM